MDPLSALREHGQSVWLDDIRRKSIVDGELARLVADGITGVTSNPAIFERAIAGGDDYDDTLRDLLDADPHATTVARYEALAVEDIRAAADVLRPAYDRSGGTDGFVSLEVSPHLAHDTEGTIAEAHRLSDDVDRPNLMIKVPATAAGVPAVEELIAAGINVNVTLIFSLQQYEAVAEAYLRGLERTADPAAVASVASFFVSRIDTAVDAALEELGGEEAAGLRGTIAVAGARLAYHRYRELFAGARFEALAARGAHPQRVLWASTGTKNPDYSDVLYVEELVGPGTVNTMPPATLDAWRHHGVVRGDTIAEDPDGVTDAFGILDDLGIDIDVITARLQDDGVRLFAEAFDRLLQSIEEKAAVLAPRLLDRQHLALGAYEEPVETRLAAWSGEATVRRLWEKDHTIWSSDPRPELTDRLGWLHLPEIMHGELPELQSFADEIRADAIRHVVLLGMGGSSLAPEVFQRTFGNWDAYPELVVLDSTHPAAVGAVEARIDPVSTLFLIASKSGTTIEPLSFFEYFRRVVSAAIRHPGRHFAAITDPGSPLVDLAREHGFRRVFETVPDVGGRYSALTHFGLVPAALIGADVHRLLDRAAAMAEGSSPDQDPRAVPGFVLGAALGELALAGRDKATFVMSQTFAAFPDWIEQLIAESTGKSGTGILPVVGEPLGPPRVYGADRVFVALLLEGDTTHDPALDALEAAGHPVIRIVVDEPEDLASEMFRFELATAAAGAVLGINPFDQPDVQRAKELARQAMEGRLDAGAIPATPAADGERLAAAVGDLIASVGAGDYLALQAFIAPDTDASRCLQRIRMRLRDRLGIATTLGFGPRFLHSTGQFHKGGPNSGVFVQIVDEPEQDLEIPGTGDTFGALVAGQADGDYQALADAGRRVVRISLGNDVTAGLSALAEAVG